MIVGSGDITREFTAWCGLCSEWHQESSRTQAQAIRAFKNLGWKKTTVHGWICPNHKKEETKWKSATK